MGSQQKKNDAQKLVELFPTKPLAESPKLLGAHRVDGQKVNTLGSQGSKQHRQLLGGSIPFLPLLVGFNPI